MALFIYADYNLCQAMCAPETRPKQSGLCADEPHFSYLGPWHADLIPIDRRKCVLFVNDKTLLNFTVPDLSRAQIRELDQLFKNYLNCVLADAGIPEADRGGILSEYGEVGHAGTNSNSVQGVHKYPDIQACVPAPFDGGGTGWGSCH
jgi:hypothetical protein